MMGCDTKVHDIYLLCVSGIQPLIKHQIVSSQAGANIPCSRNWWTWILIVSAFYRLPCFCCLQQLSSEEKLCRIVCHSAFVFLAQEGLISSFTLRDKWLVSCPIIFGLKTAKAKRSSASKSYNFLRSRQKHQNCDSKIRNSEIFCAIFTKILTKNRQKNRQKTDSVSVPEILRVGFCRVEKNR